MNFINELFDKAVDTYNVNPYIFVGFYLLTIPVYYYGHFIMIKCGLRYYKKNKKLKLGGLVKSRGFLRGLIINRLGWVIPHIYVISFGRNLPLWVYVLIFLWLLITSFVIIWKTKDKVILASKKYKIADKEEIIEARKFLAKRYVEAGYLEKNKSKEIYSDKYVDNSVYFVATRIDEVVGVIRVIHNSKNGLPTRNDFKLYDSESARLSLIKSEKIVEIGNLAALSGQGIAKGLYKIVIRYCVKKKLIVVACIDSVLLNRLLAKYWFFRPFVRQIGEPIFYMGSMTTPIRLSFNLFMVLFI